MNQELNPFVQTIPALIGIAIIGLLTYFLGSEYLTTINCALLHMRVLQGSIALSMLICAFLYYPLRSAPFLSRLLLFAGIPVGGLVLAAFLGAILSRNSDAQMYFGCNCRSLEQARILIDQKQPHAALLLLDTAECQGNAEAAQLVKEAEELAVDQFLQAAQDFLKDAKCDEARASLDNAVEFLLTRPDSPNKIKLAGIIKDEREDFERDTNCAKKPNPLPPSVEITVSPTAMDAGASFTLNWKSDNATSCVAEQSWDNKIETAGSVTLVAPETPGEHIYAIRCAGADGDAIAQTRITVAPKIALQLELLGFRSSHGVIDFRLKSEDTVLTDVQEKEIILSQGKLLQLQLRTDNEPTCVIAVVDNSRSIIQGPEAEMGLVRVREAIDTLNQWQINHPNVELGMVVFDETLKRTLPDKLPLKPETITATGNGTYLWSAVEDGLNLATECSRRVSPLDRYLFVITDGANTQMPPFPDPEKLRQTAVDQKTGICTVGIAGKLLEEPVLKNLAEGCDYKKADTAAKVATILKQNLDNTANSYRLTTAGDFCPLTLELRKERLTVCGP